MGILGRRREEAAAAKREDAIETQAWIAWVDGIENAMPSDGVLTVGVVEELRAPPIRQRPSQVGRDLAYGTARQFTSQLAARRSREAILESGEAKAAGDLDSMNLHMLRYRYMQEISERLAL